jgi:pyruvate/2-oxoglutarate dehydrogenase complex dihydrolipoamide acyltransferase (E2) component
MQAFRFIDLPTAAEVLGTTRARVLQYVDEGALKPYSGAGQAAVFRTRDVEALVAQLGVQAAAAPPARAAGQPEAASTPETAGRRRTETIRRDPVKKVGTRLTQDVRWTEITEEDLAAWFDGLDARSYPAVRHAARQALIRLNRIMELTGGAGDTAGDRDLAASGRQISAKELIATSQPQPPAQ